MLGEIVEGQLSGPSFRFRNGYLATVQTALSSPVHHPKQTVVTVGYREAKAMKAPHFWKCFRLNSFL